MVKTCLTASKPNFYGLLNLPKRNPKIFWDIVMENDLFVMMLFNNYMSKVNFSIENKVTFTSCIICGELFNLIIKNFALVCPSRDIRIEIINQLKRCIPILSDFINKSQTMYRRLLKDETIKLPGRVTIKPLTTLRLLLAETLFNIVEVDVDRNYESLTKIYDSTYHMLFIFAMEKCHNNLYLVKFLAFLKLFFKHAPEITILNIIFKLNI